MEEPVSGADEVLQVLDDWKPCADVGLVEELPPREERCPPERAVIVHRAGIGLLVRGYDVEPVKEVPLVAPRNLRGGRAVDDDRVDEVAVENHLQHTVVIEAAFRGIEAVAPVRMEVDAVRIHHHVVAGREADHAEVNALGREDLLLPRDLVKEGPADAADAHQDEVNVLLGAEEALVAGADGALHLV